MSDFKDFDSQFGADSQTNTNGNVSNGEQLSDRPDTVINIQQNAQPIYGQLTREELLASIETSKRVELERPKGCLPALPEGEAAG